jgi:hypothetical protein
MFRCRIRWRGMGEMLPVDSGSKDSRHHSVLSSKILSWLVLILPLSICLQTYGETPRWKVFTSRAGWSINYPSEWKIGSCKSCPDPTAPDVFVDFLPPKDKNSGWVMVEHLAGKPSSTTVDAWFTEIKRTANLNPRLAEQRFMLDDLPALKVRYRNPSCGGHEMEEVYVVSGSRTFSITFDGEKPGLPLEEFGNHHTFLQMLETFKVKR